VTEGAPWRESVAWHAAAVVADEQRQEDRENHKSGGVSH